MIVAFLLALTACEDRPDAPTATQNAQMDEAEAMLNAEADEEKGPAGEAAGPNSN